MNEAASPASKGQLNRYDLSGFTAELSQGGWEFDPLADDAKQPRLHPESGLLFQVGVLKDMANRLSLRF